MPAGGGGNVWCFSMREANNLAKAPGEYSWRGRIRTFRRRSPLLCEKRHREVVKSKENNIHINNTIRQKFCG